MFRCHVCGSAEAYEDSTDEVFLIEGKRVLIENIPVSRCAHCGEATFSRTTTERVRQLMHGQAQPVRTVRMKVFAFA